MSISDWIVVMKDGVLMQQGKPQQVYDDPANLFVAKFLGTPPINVFAGSVKSGKLFLGEQAVLPVADVKDGEVLVGIRPEGFLPDPEGSMVCGLQRIEIMGRDTSMVCEHPALQGETLRVILQSRQSVAAGEQVRFHLLPEKVFLFSKDTQQRIPFSVHAAEG